MLEKNPQNRLDIIEIDEKLKKFPVDIFEGLSKNSTNKNIMRLFYL